MVIRLLFLGLVAVLSVATVLNGSGFIEPAGAEGQVSGLIFSSGMNSKFEPSGVAVEFPGGNDGVYVTFTFSDLPSGSGLSRIVRFNGDDYNFDNDTFGRLNCCNAGGSGRYGFRVVKRSGQGGDLPGGSYDVRIYLNGNEIQHGGFGIKGTGGGDHDNSSHGNDNN